MPRYILGFLLSFIGFIIGMTMVVAVIPHDTKQFGFILLGISIMLVSGASIGVFIEKQQQALGKKFKV